MAVRRRDLAVLALVALLLPAPLAAHELLAPGIGDPALVVGCRLDTRPFQTLAVGLIDYCRGHLRYEVGALDCYQFSSEVCAVFFPASGAFTEVRRPVERLLFACPPGPEPPVCPRLTWR